MLNGCRTIVTHTGLDYSYPRELLVLTTWDHKCDTGSMLADDDLGLKLLRSLLVIFIVPPVQQGLHSDVLGCTHPA